VPSVRASHVVVLAEILTNADSNRFLTDVQMNCSWKNAFTPECSSPFFEETNFEHLPIHIDEVRIVLNGHHIVAPFDSGGEMLLIV